MCQIVARVVTLCNIKVVMLYIHNSCFIRARAPVERVDVDLLAG